MMESGSFAAVVGPYMLHTVIYACMDPQNDRRPPHKLETTVLGLQHATALHSTASLERCRRNIIAFNRFRTIVRSTLS